MEYFEREILCNCTTQTALDSDAIIPPSPSLSRFITILGLGMF